MSVIHQRSYAFHESPPRLIAPRPPGLVRGAGRGAGHLGQEELTGVRDFETINHALFLVSSLQRTLDAKDQIPKRKAARSYEAARLVSILELGGLIIIYLLLLHKEIYKAGQVLNHANTLSRKE